MAFDLKYIGHSGFEIDFPDERKSILIDPYLEINKAYNYTNLDITDIFLTHGHNDHTGGLRYLSENIMNKNIEIIAHPHCFNQKYFGDEYIGTPVTKQEHENNFE